MVLIFHRQRDGRVIFFFAGGGGGMVARFLGETEGN